MGNEKLQNQLAKIRVNKSKNTIISIIIQQFSKYWAITIIMSIIVGTYFLFTTIKYPTIDMNGSINIVVIPMYKKIGVLYSNYSLFTDNEGKKIANSFYSQFVDSEIGIENEIQVLDPNYIPPSVTFDPNEKAQQISNKYGAQIVVYGYLSENRLGDQVLTTKIYISPENFTDSAELLGNEILGLLDFGEVTLTGEFQKNINLVDQNKQFRECIYNYSQIIRALGAFYSEDTDLALKYLDAVKLSEFWNDSPGLEIAFLISGNVHLREATRKSNQGDVTNIEDELNMAEKEYFAAVRIFNSEYQDNYARAYIGLAGVENLRAVYKGRVNNNDPNLIDTGLLDSAIGYLNIAKESKYKTANSDIEVKIYYSNAQISLSYYMKTLDKKYLNDSIDNYKLVIHEYDFGNERIKELAALSYVGIASIYDDLNQDDLAEESYLQAYDLTRMESLQIRILVKLTYICIDRNDLDKAKYYCSVVNQRQNRIESALTHEQINEYNEKCNQLLFGEKK